MTSKLCKYGCGVLLEGFDEENRKFLEAGTGGLHTKERCQEAKAKLEQKNDHGNELVQAKPESPKEMFERYVDHTQGQKLKLKIFTDPTTEGLMLSYNSFAEKNSIKFSQYQIAGSLYTIAVWFEEIKQ